MTRRSSTRLICNSFRILAELRAMCSRYGTKRRRRNDWILMGGRRSTLTSKLISTARIKRERERLDAAIFSIILFSFSRLKKVIYVVCQVKARCQVQRLRVVAAAWSGWFPVERRERFQESAFYVSRSSFRRDPAEKKKIPPGAKRIEQIDFSSQRPRNPNAMERRERERTLLPSKNVSVLLSEHADARSVTRTF